MIKKNSAISGVLLFLVIAAISCGKQKQHDIEKVFDKMLKGGPSEDIAKAKSYTINSLDFVPLDSLGLTKEYIDAWTKLYIDKNATDDLVKDSKKLIDRLGRQSQGDIETFITAIAHNNALTEYPDAAASIVAYAYGIDIPNGESSEIANRLLTFTRLSGKKSPQIEGLKTLEGVNSTIVLFYDGSCGICQHILDDLARNYDQLTTKNIRIVTISADGSKDEFERNIKKYPWADKLCDYQSFNSVNFKRFGIAATPTMFVIDKNGIVVSEFDDLKETGLL